MSHADTDTFEAKKDAFRKRIKARAAEHARTMAALDAAAEAEASGSIEMTPEEFYFALDTGADPTGEQKGGTQKDH